MKTRMVPDRFLNHQLGRAHDKWEQSLQRGGDFIPSEDKPDDTLPVFGLFPILHCISYRRLKHKTQVFFATQNDHICTRMEHVNHVVSISYTISKFMGLNTELTQAIALGHDLGHSPFVTKGKHCFQRSCSNGRSFWHEKNALYTADKIATRPMPNMHKTCD